MDLRAAHGGQEAQLALAQSRDRARRTHRAIENDGHALRPTLALDGLDEIVERFAVLGATRQGAPAQGVAVLVAQKQDADLVAVVEALLGATALGEVRATPLEPEGDRLVAFAQALPEGERGLSDVEVAQQVADIVDVVELLANARREALHRQQVRGLGGQALEVIELAIAAKSSRALRKPFTASLSHFSGTAAWAATRAAARRIACTGALSRPKCYPAGSVASRRMLRPRMTAGACHEETDQVRRPRRVAPRSR
ncbi:MAG: hypothetical protein IPL40_00620 [Proteobacteria bacterium]|nr:hypothetical protein [Pseudomonadota bacterium]